MTERAVDLGTLEVQGQSLAAGLDDLVAGMSLSWRTEQVAELAVTSHDVGGRLAATRLGTLGSTVRYGDDPWQVAAVDTTWSGGNVEWTFRCRSELARRLRQKVKVSAERNRSAGDWVAARAKAAGGRAVVQGSAKKALIAQANDQTELDIINDLAQQLGWSWTEWGNRIVFGSRHWAWKDGVPGFATYPVTWGRDERTDALEASAAQTADDGSMFASIDLSVPYAQGKRLRPWQRLALDGFGRYDGVWLVESVTWTPDGVSPVAVTATLPKKGVPQPAASNDGDAGGTVDPNSKRGAVVAYALAQVNKEYSYNANPPNSWDCSKLTAWAWRQAGLNLTAYTYTQVTECDQISESQMLPGDLIFYFRDAHHVSMYIGGGRIVEAASPSSGVRTATLHNSWNDAHVSGYYRPKGAPAS